MSGAVLIAEHEGAAAYHATWSELLAVVDGCDALIVDAPYSARTHAGHDGCAVGDARPRRARGYACWTASDVAAFVQAWSPRTRGWFVSITDHTLAPAWAAAFERAGRYAFAPLAFVAPGSRVRPSGDGPSAWTEWIIVARPRTKTFATWGTLPGAYVLPPGYAERMPVVGGKPLWLLERLVEDYCGAGDLVVDPCCGGGTTLLAAQNTGRRAIGGDALRAHAALTARRIVRAAQAAALAAAAPAPEQLALRSGA